MPTTTNYGWTTPADTDLVKDGASAIRTLGTSIDTTVFTNAGNAIQKSIVDAKGDLIVATAADTVARLAVGGTNGHVLQVDSSTASGLKWDAVAAGGMTLINTGGTTLTGASVTISSIPATYRDLQLIVENFMPANDGEQLAFRFNGDTTANRHSTQNAVGTGSFSFASTAISVSQSQDNSVSQALTRIDVPDYANTATWKMLLSYSLNNNNATSTNGSWVFYQGFYNQTSAISSIQLACTAGNFTSGTAYLYGVK
jgi:hypothetical protein